MKFIQYSTFHRAKSHGDSQQAKRDTKYKRSKHEITNTRPRPVSVNRSSIAFQRHQWRPQSAILRAEYSTVSEPPPLCICARSGLFLCINWVSLAPCASLQCPVWLGACRYDRGCDLLHLSVQHNVTMIGSKLCVISAEKEQLQTERDISCRKGSTLSTQSRN